jgi:hypothetical protein
VILPELMEPNINDVNKWLLSQRLSKENTKKLEELTRKQEGIIVKMLQIQRSQLLKKEMKKLVSS